MGYGIYSSVRGMATAQSYATHSRSEVFESRRMDASMSPKDAFRESRDSDTHANSVPIIIGLDVTGSMVGVPYYMITEGLVHIFRNITDKGVKDPQILFLGIGDAYSDDAPLQVGQFESDDERLNNWLKKVWLEGGGGGNGGESYDLAWCFASQHTATDAFDKRGKKGVLVTIGDEPCHPVGACEQQCNALFGGVQHSKNWLKDAQEKYDVYHVHVDHGTYSGVVEGWKKLLGEKLVVVDKQEQIADAISKIILATQSVPSKATTTVATKVEDVGHVFKFDPDTGVM